MINNIKFNEYDQFPPYPYFIDVLKHAPLALQSYIDLWNLRDKEGRVILNKKEIRNILLITPTKLKGHLYELIDLSLASVDESPLMLVIDLIQWDAEDDE